MMLAKKKVLIATGGTGGHVFPACALGQQLRKFSDEVDVLFAGGKLDQNVYFPFDEFAFRSVDCGLSSKSSVSSIFSKGAHTLKGIWESHRLLKEYKPDVVVSFGSYTTLPLLVASKMRNIPLVLHESNYVPGKMTRSFSRFAKVTGVHFSATSSLIKGKTLEVGVPLREGYTATFKSSEKAKEYFQFNSDKITLLVFGGSQGALKLNTEVSSAMLELAERSTNFQVIHLTGSSSMTKEVTQFYKGLGISAYVKDFEERMDLAWSAADIAVTRSGAITIAEAIAFEVPTLLVPYPYATDAHQEKNALYLSETIRGGKVLYHGQNVASNIVKVIIQWMSNERKEWKALKENIKQFKTQQAQRDFCSVVCEVAKVKVR